MKICKYMLLLLLFVAGYSALAVDSEPNTPSAPRLSTEEWHALMNRVRNFEEAAYDDLLVVVEQNRCPGRTEEFVAMLKIAAGCGHKRAQYYLEYCYKEGIGVQRNADKGYDWKVIREHDGR